MIKNIIFDVGGIIADDSKENISKLLNKPCDLIYKKAYGKSFDDCLIGKKTMEEHIASLKDEEEYEDICYILDKKNLPISYPIIKDNIAYIKTLKEQGYHLYLLSNMTKDSYDYLNGAIDFLSLFDGGIYSFQENLVKPNPEIYNLIIDRYNLNKEETIFFDDREKNVNAAISTGIKSYVFKSKEDVEDVLH